jgi:benzodiazapine receptor
MQKYLRIIYCVTICLVIGFLSGKVTQSSISTWYPTLQKPSFNPPNWIFAPVWTMLYIFMGIAAGLIWNEINSKEKEVKQGLKFFVIQLALNALWSYLFFGLQNVFLAALEVILLLLMIYETYIKFKPIHRNASYLLLPYMVWVSFASVLTWSIWFLNR